MDTFAIDENNKVVQTKSEAVDPLSLMQQQKQAQDMITMYTARLATITKQLDSIKALPNLPQELSDKMTSLSASIARSVEAQSAEVTNEIAQ